MKIDCSNILNFKKEHERMCLNSECFHCPFYGNFTSCNPEDLSLESITEEMIDILQDWSDEHQQKTLLEDFLEKHPNAKLIANNTPNICPYHLGYDKEVPTDDECNQMTCAECWNRLLDEVEKE